MENKNVKRAIGQILEGKNGKPYLKFDQDVSFEKGDTCWLNDFKDQIQFRVEKGYIDESEAERILEKQSFVLFTVEKAKKTL